MLRPTLIALIALTGAAASSQALSAEERTIEPGYWDVTNKLSAIVSQTKKEKRCISPAEVSKFVEGPSNRHYKCTYPTRVFHNGKITLKGSCATKNGHTVQVKATGSYSPSTFKMVADIDTTWSGLPISGRAITEARRLSDTCPATPSPS